MLLPNTRLGVAFKSGDVLELVDSQDLNWWQVRRIDAPNSPVGLVPSQTLEERRQAFNQQAFRSRHFNTLPIAIYLNIVTALILKYK